MKTLMEQMQFARRGVAVRRYHTCRTLVEDTVGSHSASVALLCWLFDPAPSAELLKAALSHDLSEHVLGDIPAPAKRALSTEARSAFDAEDNRLLLDHGFFVDLDEGDARTLKLADIADGMLFCVEERERGNKSLDWVFANYLAYSYQLVPMRSEHSREQLILNNIEFLWVKAGGQL